MRNTRRLTVMIVITMILVCAASLCISATVYSQGKNKKMAEEQHFRTAAVGTQSAAG
ncbi:MAG: hypothetical protein K2G19_00845 [Lachnospiraceae bacterium]|nr:hypothetical protein [Lachnospiraceae bacterium]